MIVWNTVAPPIPGLYQRRHAFGVSNDIWDGERWRRKPKTHRVEIHRIADGCGGVICANQKLPWRELDAVVAQAA